ncbi:uncharacterized protein ATC70_011089 [Mucor velutinosus]|uniref:Arrestin C-terminal-like domain-containing protein n=1 Tax=Mucor velutinosus TaxID=708070 RepID=A0AAN7HTH3_9FUNG|nr:hypothetical protein ATC70_011089 [Mucor velutinosus]
MSIEINLLPEFGWSIKNQPVYGPGSVFQGFVKLNATEEQLQKAERLRIVFHASESTYHSGYANPMYNQQLFGTQKILWKQKDLRPPVDIIAGTDISIPFIIQVPMVQFPPSANVISEGDGLSYHSNFVLSAYLDQDQGKTNIIKAHKSIIYMPFIETSISKKPVHITTIDNTDSNSPESTPFVHASMSSLDYVLGDTINISLNVNNIPKKSIESISTKLYQIQTWNRAFKKDKPLKSEKKLKQLIAQNTIKQHSLETTAHFDVNTSLDVPVDGLPTFTYGLVFSIAYILQISIKRKGKLWSYDFDLADIPIKVGTLGYGIRSSEEIEFYSTFKNVFERQSEDASSSSSTANALPVPRFLDVIEYEESLPLYTDDRLPIYETVIKRHHINCIM